jgi:hypothetical protein
MFDDLSLFLPLMSLDEKVKPFECVGEKKEVWLALDDAVQLKKERDNKKEEAVLDYYLNKIYPKIKKDLPKIRKECLKNYRTHIPPKIFKQMFSDEKI